MATKLVRLKDGLMVEAVVPENEGQQISGGIADRVDSSLDYLHVVVLRACEPILATWEDIKKKAPLKEIEIEFGLSFEGEGNLFITKSKMAASLSVKIVLAHKEGQIS